ncbi:ATP-binding protein [Bradyrhizobium sp. LHD-71]|nr:ATP-binding protein [Bradyrhizobium sp. LHD-71]MDQ8728560.1 ATP-binding protein [Bradyrhizobium sp. LHD-71]
MATARHRVFIGTRLFGSFALLASFPIYVVLRGAPGIVEVACFAWLIAPILIAYYLSRTGCYERAHALSSICVAGLVTLVAINTGGMSSFAAVWLVAIPIEAALSTSRKVVTFSAIVSLVCAALLVGLDAFGWLPPSQIPQRLSPTFEALGTASVVLYCATLAFVAEMLVATSRSLLNAEEKRYRLLARNMGDVITRHRRNGAIEFISPAAQSLFGAPLNELMAHGLFDRVHVADRPAYLTALADVARGASERDVEFRVKCGTDGDARNPSPANRFIWIEMRCRPLEQTARGTDAQVVAVMRDITERKAQEQALEDAHNEAEKAHAAKSQFLATMSHELRTPLNAIIGFSEMIVREKELALDTERRHEYAKLINDSGQHLLSVVNGILDMSKMESGGFEISAEPFVPREAIVSCCNLMALKARESGIDLVVDLPEDLPDMIGDQRALRQILLNLLSNSIKFTERGGAVTVSASVEGVNLVLAVSDTGVGISADDLQRVGDPFFQAEKTYRRRHEGTGLGLSIVKSLVSLHEGEMSVRSKLDVGTTITVMLPLDLERNKRSIVTTLTPRQKDKVEQKVKRSA